MLSPDGGSWTQIGEIIASDGVSGGEFGRVIAISGETAVAGSFAGKAYVLSGTDQSGSWSQKAELTSSDEQSGDSFGGSVAISGPNIVIGAFSHTVNGNAWQGAAYDFYDGSSGWSQTQELTAWDGAAYEDFGYGVAADGTTSLVGAPDHTVGGNTDQGATYVYSSGNQLFASNGAEDDYFGESVAIYGTTAVVGAPDQNVGAGYEQGAVYVYTLIGNLWLQTAELSSSDGASYDYFGTTVAIYGTTIAVGTPTKTIGSNTGVVYVFSYNGSSWSQTAELTANDGGGDLGEAITLSGSTIIAGAPFTTVGSNSNQGAAYVFSNNGSGWAESAELVASDGASTDELGWAVTMSGSTAVVGAIYHFSGGNADEGAAYVFSDGGGSWSQSAELTPSDGAAGDIFGDAVGISGSSILIGSPNHGNGGAVYLFNGSASHWSQSAELTASDERSFDGFGSGVAVSGPIAIIGSGNGEAYMFGLSGAAWSQTNILTAPDGQTSSVDNLAGPVAVSGTTAIVGNYEWETEQTYYIGTAFVFENGNVAQQGAPVGPDAWGGGSPSETCSSCSTSAGGTPSTTGEQLDRATGDMSLTATDLSLPGAGIPLTFTRTYDAQAAQAAVTSGANPSGLGYGWADTFAMSLAYNSTTQAATISEENGAQITFNPYVGGPSQAWCNSSINYCSEAPRVAATLNKNGSSWTFTRDTGQQETFTFNSGGTLTQISDPVGDTLTSSFYSPGSGQTACPSGDSCTSWTSSASGRELVLVT